MGSPCSAISSMSVRAVRSPWLTSRLPSRAGSVSSPADRGPGLLHVHPNDDRQVAGGEVGGQLTERLRVRQTGVHVVDRARPDHDEQPVVVAAQHAVGQQAAVAHRTGRGSAQRQLAHEPVGGVVAACVRPAPCSADTAVAFAELHGGDTCRFSRIAVRNPYPGAKSVFRREERIRPSTQENYLLDGRADRVCAGGRRARYSSAPSCRSAPSGGAASSGLAMSRSSIASWSGVPGGAW